ncbi:conserved protein of unknown function [Rhodovastum atsumiense]|uniref:DUF2892 domain-containing protein n=1 Tax=Rhodovastum atsumiense TaxID=504468 RepID=A0A5M6ITX9_9PROT|nr:DUF2892 domain-containing protein [Rhodovastum atsumiense]KAA5611297.1 DUF2892 domain-containing protein [Rhodovastum atsumiense]CAH2601766.1 conserved protein of unknown function [Rhodovastum atsumiense]
MNQNIGTTDRVIRIVAGLALLAFAALGTGDLRWLGLIGIVPLGTALVRWCPLYTMIGLRT